MREANSLNSLNNVVSLGGKAVAQSAAFSAAKGGASIAAVNDEPRLAEGEAPQDQEPEDESPRAAAAGREGAGGAKQTLQFLCSISRSARATVSGRTIH